MLGKDWSDGFLDYHRDDKRVRVTVSAWLSVGPVTDVYYRQPRTFRTVWNYIRAHGIRVVAQKILSRMRESLRDRRVFAVGLGTVCESDPESSWPAGTPVAFVAPTAPPCVERLVLPVEFVRRVDDGLVERTASSDGIRWTEGGQDHLWDDELVAWDAFSGRSVPKEALDRVFPQSLEFWRSVMPARGRVLPLPAATPIEERLAKAQRADERLTGVVFGLGNLAKATLIPCVRQYVRIACAHEIEPTQLGKTDRLRWSADTSPVIRDDEDYDVYFIAGYHHTHADLAAEALRKGAWVVCEKPLVTTERELAVLLTAVREHPGRLFACFQMRYGPLWSYARRDMRVRPGDPVNYQCIVFESPVPRHHWYNWPNSRSRLVSNGTHWLDHFLFMNDFADVTDARVWTFRNEDLSVNVELATGAAMNMLITQQGSPRIGIQEHVELRANNVTVRVDNSSRYSAEGPDRFLRRKRSRRLVSHKTMYRTICQKLVAGKAGDTLRSIEMSCRLLLDLEAQLPS